MLSEPPLPLAFSGIKESIASLFQALRNPRVFAGQTSRGPNPCHTICTTASFSIVGQASLPVIDARSASKPMPGEATEMATEPADQLSIAGAGVDFGNGRAARIYDRQGRLSHYFSPCVYASRAPKNRRKPSTRFAEDPKRKRKSGR